MEIYRVGGCVRDRLLGESPRDLDYVVVGSNEEDMKQLGYKRVGSAFPVFLHPLTGDEYALARKEIKVGVGYTGFTCNVDSITLEEDLLRRDLTINAMAMDESDNLYDPFNGAQDLEDKVFRHTSDAFAEDPVRVLRVARFMARYGSEWTVHPSTLELMKKIVPELQYVSSERIWMETEKALGEESLWEYFKVLNEVGFCLVNEELPIPIVEKYTFEAVLRRGSYLTVEDKWALISGFNTAARRAEIEELLKIPKRFQDASKVVWEDDIVDGWYLDAEDMLKYIKRKDFIRKPERLDQAIRCNNAFIGDTSTSNDLSELWRNVMEAVMSVKGQKFVDEGFTGKDLGDKMRFEQIKAIHKVIENEKESPTGN